HDGVVDPVLHTGHRVGYVVDAFEVRIVLGKQQLDGPIVGRADIPPAFAEGWVGRVRRSRANRSYYRALHSGLPRPRVAIPEVGQDMDGRGIGAAVDGRDVAEHILGGLLRILHEHVKVAVRGERVAQGVEQL